MKKVRLFIGLVFLKTAAFGAVYEVGKVGTAYPTIASVPWTTLRPGDTVKIYAKTDAGGNPVAYHERLFLTVSGTQDFPITVSGVPDSNGRLPVIDGDEATTSFQFQFMDPVWNYLGLVQVHRANYIVVENLQIQGAYSTSADPSYYYDAFGTKKSWDASAGLYIIGAKNITARNNVLTDNGNGLFVNSNNFLSQNILAEGNKIYANGKTGSFLEHNVYTEANVMTFQQNYIGNLRSGAAGSSFKDRSTGLVFRYNFIDDCAARCMDLVDIEADALRAAYDANPSIAARSFVYGNTILNLGDAGNMIHHSSEGKGQPNAHGVVYFYDNTFYADYGTVSTYWRPAFFQVDSGRTINAVNNVFYLGGNTQLQSFMSDSGTLNFTGPNWASSSIADNNDRSNAVVNGRANLLANAQNNPGFISAASKDFRPAAGSQLIGKGGSLDVAVLPTHNVTLSYAPPSGNARGNILDLGSFPDPANSGGDNPPPSGAAPSIQLTGPSNDSTFTLPTAITITASASDPDGIVTKVDFYRGTTLLGSDATAPYAFNWTYAPAGNHLLRAVATDNSGATGSDQVSITVAQGANDDGSQDQTNNRKRNFFTPPETVAIACEGNIEIISRKGNKIKRIVCSNNEGIWDGVSDSGEIAASGIYYAVTGSMRKKIVMIR